MKQFRRTFVVPRPLAVVADYVSDFGTSAEWQPFTVRSRRLDDAPTVRGSRFEVVRHLAGRDFVMEYRVVEYDPRSHIRLRGQNRYVTTEDDVRFETAGEDSTQVTYGVTVELHRQARVGEAMIRPIMERIADQSSRSLRERVEKLG